MGDITRFHMVCTGVGLIGAVLIGIGMFGKGWMVFSFSMDSEQNSKQSVTSGIWSMEVCSRFAQGLVSPICVSITISHLMDMVEQVEEKYKQENDGFRFQDRHGYLTVQILMTLGCLLVCAALILLAVYLFCVKKNVLFFTRRYFCLASTICFFVTGILIFVSVGLKVSENVDLKKEFDQVKTLGISDTFVMTLHFPWSILVSGIGALIGIILGIALLFHMRIVSRANQDGDFMPVAYRNEV